MTRPRVPVCAALVGLLAIGSANAARQPAAQAPAPQLPPTFRSGTAAVTVDANVSDRNGRPVGGLTASDFELIDNGVPQQVDDVSYGRLPIDVTIALDVSHSVSGSVIERLRRAVAQLMRDLPSQDRLKLVLFNMRVTRTLDYTTDVKAVDRAMRATAAGGGTALFDAVAVTLVSTAPADRRQLAVFFTDGSDSSSTTPPETLANVAQRTRATLSFVVPATANQPLATANGVISFRSSVTRFPNQPLITTLARETGGTILPVGAGTDLSAAFRSILTAFRSTYVLYYQPRGVDRTGYHKLEVKVKRDGVRVQARRGYFGLEAR